MIALSASIYPRRSNDTHARLLFSHGNPALGRGEFFWGCRCRVLVVAQPAAAKIICRRTASLGRSLLPGLQGDPGGILRRDAGPGDGGVVACLLAPQQLMMMMGDSRSVMPCAHPPSPRLPPVLRSRCGARAGLEVFGWFCFFVSLFASQLAPGRICTVQQRDGPESPESRSVPGNLSSPYSSLTSSTTDSPEDSSPLVHRHVSCMRRRPSGSTSGRETHRPVMSWPSRLTWW